MLRGMSSSAIKISSNLVLKQVTDRKINGNSVKGKKKLVLFFPWLYASEKVVQKYCDFYHARNMDVLWAKVELKHFLIPSSGRKFAVEILDYLRSNSLPLYDDRYLVHAFSIGAYLYSIILLEMENNLNKYNPILKKIYGQIFDSITVGGLNRMGRGIAEFTSNPMVRRLIQTGATSYFALTKPYTVNYYDKTIYQFKEKPIKTPVLFFYCLNDPMAASDVLEEIITSWRSAEKFNMEISVKCWEKSVHAGHLKEHPEDYMNTLHLFLQNIGMLTSKM